MTAIAPSAPQAPARWTAGIRRRLGWWLQPQVSSAARDRRDVAIVLMAVLIAVAPHFWHLPWWSTALIGLLWFWRAWLTVARRPPPGRVAMVPLLASATAVVWLQHGSIIGHEAGVNLLVLLIGLKLLELRGRRDLNLVVFLAFFVQITLFLYDQSLLVGVLAVCTTLLLFFVLLSINLAETDLTAARKAALVLIMFAKSLPLALALFLLFPRLQAPLLAFGRSEAASSTGLSDSMSPGSINRLIESDAEAFTVRFKGSVPSPNRLYWRGPVFDHFDGRTWTASLSQRSPPRADPPENRPDWSTRVDYTVAMKPTGRNWVLGLELSTQVDSNDFQPSWSDDGQPLADTVLNHPVSYNVQSYTGFHIGPFDRNADMLRWTQLPDSNNKTKQFAGDLRIQYVDPSERDQHAHDPELVDKVLKHFSRGGFHYTLTPPLLLGSDPIDDFLFTTRLGFCEHYASAFVFLMRALNIPARVVTGYQGGEINPFDSQVLTVRQSDAHAWAEVWLPGRGWKRVDPTAVVSPLRIEQGEAKLASQYYRGAGGLMGWIHTWRLNWEALENVWNLAVLGYSADRQRSLIAQLGVEPSWRNLAIAFAVTVTILLAALAAVSLRHREVRDPLADLVARVRARLALAGLRSPASEGLTDLRRRLMRELRPAQAEEAAALLLALEDARYRRNDARPRPAELRSLRARVRRFRPVPARP